MADDEEIHNTTVRTVLGSTRREQRWDLAHEVDITTMLGKSFFDLRLARPMGESDVEISITCFLGSVELLVPVGTRVTLEGSTFLAGASSDVSGEDDVPPSDEDGVDLTGKPLPRLDIAATATLGRVRVRTPDRPERARPQRFARLRRKKSKSTAASKRALADILANADDEIRRPVEHASPAEPQAPASEPLSPKPAMPPEAPATADRAPAPAPTHGSSAVDATIAVSGPKPDTAGAAVDAEITRSTPTADSGPVDVAFAASGAASSIDDFDPADFPDDAAVAS